MFKNILIIGHSNIGDACYDAAIIAPLHTHFPQARISFLTSSRAQNILQGYPGLSKIFLFDKHTQDKGLFGYLKLIQALRKEKFDLAIVLKSTLLHKFLGVPQVWSVREYPGCCPTRIKKHIADIYLELLKAKGLPLEETRFNFNLSSEDKSFAGDFLKKQSLKPDDTLIGILPIAAWSLKSWPIEKWNELAKILKAQHSGKVIALGKSGNDPFGHKVLKNMSLEIISAIDQTTLKQAMALLTRCSLFIAPDSSLLHLASCMGVQALGLYGPTSAGYIYPYFHRQNIVVSQAALACRPCYPGIKAIVCKREFQPGECMEAISVEEVLKMAEAKLPREDSNGKR